VRERERERERERRKMKVSPHVREALLPKMFIICSDPLCKMEGEILNTAALLVVP